MMQAKLTGGERMRRVLDRLPKQIEDDVEKAVLKGAHEIAAAQKLLVPVSEGADGGKLRDSIVVTPAGQTTPPFSQPGGSYVVGPLSARITAGNSEVRYAHLVEYGTAPGARVYKKGPRAGTVMNHPGTGPEPFFWPGYRLNRRRVVSRIKREVGKAIRKAAGFAR